MNKIFVITILSVFLIYILTLIFLPSVILSIRMLKENYNYNSSYQSNGFVQASKVDVGFDVEHIGKRWYGTWITQGGKTINEKKLVLFNLIPLPFYKYGISLVWVHIIFLFIFSSVVEVYFTTKILQ